jgi:Peptidase family M48
MSWNIDRTRQMAQRFIQTLTTKLGFRAEYGGMPISGAIVVQEDTSVNAFGVAVNDTWGVEVTDLFTRLVTNDLAIYFVVGHELGHFFTEQLIAAMGWRDVRDEGVEIVADLLSFFGLSQMGYAPDSIISDVTAEQDKVFNSVSNSAHSGKHPLAANSLACLHTLKELLQDGHSFVDSAKAILANWRVEEVRAPAQP